MSKNFNKEFLALAFLLPLLWLSGVYLINPFWFVEDKFGSARFLIFFFLILIYFKPSPEGSLKKLMIDIMLIFIVYIATLYAIDTFINFKFDTNLKLEYYDEMYADTVDSAEDELKSINEDYKVSSKDEMVAALISKNYSLSGYFRRVFIDFLKIATLSVFITMFYSKRDAKTGNIFC